jgi:predicted Zn-dependent protease
MRDREELTRSWEITRGHLAEARAALVDPRSDDSALREYEDYLGHNELELAMDCLMEAGEVCKATPEFWQALARAAANMGLHDRADEFLRR